jgi:hypothetical protein
MSVPAVGELVPRPDGSVLVSPPRRCINGHGLGPHRVLVGHRACSGGHHGHVTWMCCQCDDVTYGPPLDDGCQVLTGAG